jgi:hypothetical protein
MTPAQFVRLFAKEKRDMLGSYLSDPDTAVGGQIKAMDLSARELKALRAVLDGVLTDAFYTVLLALDGAASLGGKQITYSLRDEEGRELTGGEIEAAAWEQFHGADKPSKA